MNKMRISTLPKLFVEKAIFYLRLIRKKKSTFIGFIIIISYILMAMFGPMIIRLDLSANPSEAYAPPSFKHPLGTDYAGRDVLMLIVNGSREVLLVAFLTGLITVVIALLVGMTSGFIGGKVDLVLTTLIDILLTIPGFPLLLVVSIILSKYLNIFTVALVLSISPWAGLARAIRSQVLSIKESTFIEAAKALGLPLRHIIFREILPIMYPYILVNYLFAMLNAIYSQVGLYFIGALPISTMNWGVMMNLARSAGAIQGISGLHYLLAPMITIVILQIGLILFAKGADEILNPRLREE